MKAALRKVGPFTGPSSPSSPNVPSCRGQEWGEASTPSSVTLAIGDPGAVGSALQLDCSV